MFRIIYATLKTYGFFPILSSAEDGWEFDSRVSGHDVFAKHLATSIRYQLGQVRDQSCGEASCFGNLRNDFVICGSALELTIYKYSKGSLRRGYLRLIYIVIFWDDLQVE